MTTAQKKLPWLEEAFKYEGLREIKGRRHSNQIVKWLKQLGGWWFNDEVPWCGTFVGACLDTTNRGVPKYWMRAKAYLKYGTRLKSPAYGSIAIMGRKGGGHVFFVLGETRDGRIVGYGGNQSDMVCIRTFRKSQILGYVWPTRFNANGIEVNSMPYPERFNLPVYSNNIRSVKGMA